MVNANYVGSNLSVAYPNSSKQFTPRRSNFEFSEKINEQLFELAQIFMQILTASAQIDNRITHELSRPVISGLAATIDGENGMRQMAGVQFATANPSWGGQTRSIRRPSDRVNRFMLE